MNDIDKITDFLRSYVGEDKVLTYATKPMPIFNGKCLMDLAKEGRTDEALDKIAEVLDAYEDKQ